MVLVLFVYKGVSIKGLVVYGEVLLKFQTLSFPKHVF